MASAGDKNLSISPAIQPDIVIYSHSPLFYWWPVWAVGFIMALLTRVEGDRMVIVPNGSETKRNIRVETKPGTTETREGVLLPEGAKLFPPEASEQELNEKMMFMSHSKNYGVLWVVVLLVIIFVSNVPLRGLWSIVVIVTVVLLATILALAKVWDQIFEWFAMLRIQINMGGYLFISIVLFIIWASTFFFFDRRVYMVFSSGQMRVCTEIGEGEKVYDATGISFQKHQNDIFRHWIIGMGAGDLSVKTGGPHPEHFEFPNVLFVGHKVKKIEQRLKSREVV